MITFKCPRCRADYSREDHQAGTKFHCPSCGQKLQVPAAPVLATAPAVPEPLVVGLPPNSPRQKYLLIGGLLVGGYLLVGAMVAIYLFSSAKTTKTEAVDRQPAAPAPVPSPPAQASTPEVEPPPEKYTLDNLYQRFMDDPNDVKRTLTSKRLAVVMENRVWEIEDLHPDADGIIEIVAFQRSGFEKRIQMFVRFSQSKEKIVSRMQRYTEGRKRGEVVDFVVIGKLGIRNHKGREYLLLNDVELE